MTPFLSAHKFWTVKASTQVMPSVLSAYKSGRFSHVTVHTPFTPDAQPGGGHLPPPEIFKTLHSNFDICTNFQIIRMKFIF